jgi:hypothetical protein
MVPQSIYAEWLALPQKELFEATPVGLVFEVVKDWLTEEIFFDYMDWGGKSMSRAGNTSWTTDVWQLTWMRPVICGQ